MMYDGRGVQGVLFLDLMDFVDGNSVEPVMIIRNN